MELLRLENAKTVIPPHFLLKCGGTIVLELLRLENEVWVSPNHREVFIPCRVQVSFAVVVSFLSVMVPKISLSWCESFFLSW